MELPTNFPTGIHDIDREILFNVPDKKLFRTCIKSKYMQQVCNESFWRNKFIREFGTDLGKYADKSYRDLYRILSPLSNYELFEASIQYGYLPIIKSLFEENIIDIHNEGDKALISAAYYGHLDAVKYLIENGANIHAEDDAALRNAAYNDHLDIAKYLIEGPEDAKGDKRPWGAADIHAMNDLALRIAAYHGNLDIVKYLIENGANIHVNNDELLYFLPKEMVENI
jgi:ankyrin repeat protein